MQSKYRSVSDRFLLWSVLCALCNKGGARGLHQFRAREGKFRKITSRIVFLLFLDLFEMQLWLFAVGAATLVGLFKWWRNRIPNIPGPWGVPIFGYLPFLGIKMNLTLTNLSKKYGPVYQLQMGSRRFVIVNGQKAVREGLTGSKGADMAARLV